MKESAHNPLNNTNWYPDCKKITKITNITPYGIYLRKEKLLKIENSENLPEINSVATPM